MLQEVDQPTFTTDWRTMDLTVWREQLAHLKDRPADYLEIGSWEGRSALFICEYLPKARLTCIDAWLAEFMADAIAAEGRFDANMAPYADRVRKIKARSTPGLDQLWAEDAKFDVIYIDAHHARWYVLADAIMSWPLLREGGILIFDDYGKVRASDQPKDGINLFGRAFAECAEVLYCRYQVMLRKKSDWPQRFSTKPAIFRRAVLDDFVRSKLKGIRRRLFGRRH